MPDFGKQLPRSPKSFGVSGLLAEDCEIYYENFFGTEHVGRVSDLICARLREHGLDELKIRALVLFSVFEGCRARSGAKSPEAAMEPMTLECGIDEEKVAIGLAFRGNLDSNVEELRKRLSEARPAGEFERLLLHIHEKADAVLLRIQPGVQFEIVSFLGLPGKVEPPKARIPLEVIVFSDRIEIEKAPAAGKFIELGDVNYAELLRAAGTARAIIHPPGGEVLAREFSELESALRARARSALAETGLVSTARGEHADDEDIQIVKGGAEDVMDSTAITVRGQSFKSLLKKVWPFKKSGEKKIPEPRGEGDLFEKMPEKAAVSSEAESISAVPVSDEAQAGPSKEEVLISSLVEGVEKGGIDQALTLMRSELKRPGEVSSDVKAKSWMEGVVRQLGAEKERLTAVAKELTHSVHQKEAEFRKREALLKKELRQKDESLRQKSNSLTRVKEQLDIAMHNMERLRSASKQDRSGDSQLKQKYEMTQRLLVTSREENIRLASKIEEFKGQVSTAQLNLKNRESALQADLANTKSRYERTLKLMEELKTSHEQLANMNKQLSGKIQQLAVSSLQQPKEGGAAKSASVSAEEQKDARKLEWTSRQLANSQKEAEAMRLKIEEYRREELRMKRELLLAQQELKSLKAKASPKKDGSGGRAA